jgi:hypothetical protein
VVPSFRCTFLPDMPSSLTPGSSIIVTVQNLDADTVFTESQPARRSLISRNPIHAGAHFRGFTGSQLLRPVRLLAPLDGSDWDTSPATGDFYFQASDGSVALPAAGYNYDSNWTPLCRRDLHPLEWQLASLHWLAQACGSAHRNGSLAKRTTSRANIRRNESHLGNNGTTPCADFVLPV